MRAQFGKLIRESHICVLCGENKAITSEHIPPQGLFRELPNPYLTVPACDECNEGSSLDDEYLQQTMSAISLVGEGRNVWNEKVAPKLQNRPKTKAGLRNAVTIGELETEQFGKFITPQFKISEPRLKTTIKKMVFGLHWFHTGNLLPKKRNPIVALYDVPRGTEIFKTRQFQNAFEMTVSGVYQEKVTNTFFYTYSALPLASIWFFFFYKQIVVTAVTYPPRRHRR